MYLGRGRYPVDRHPQCRPNHEHTHSDYGNPYPPPAWLFRLPEFGFAVFCQDIPPLKGPIADQNGLYCVRADKPIDVAAIISWICFAICLLGILALPDLRDAGQLNLLEDAVDLR